MRSRGKFFLIGLNALFYLSIPSFTNDSPSSITKISFASKLSDDKTFVDASTYPLAYPVEIM
jgi:hypothetical protein